MSVMIKCTLCSGGSRGGSQGAHSPLTFRPNCGPKGQNNFLEGPPPPYPYLRVWMTRPPPYLKVWIWQCCVHFNMDFHPFKTINFALSVSA